MLGLALAEETEADRLLTQAAHININYDAVINENRKIITSHYDPKLSGNYIIFYLPTKKYN